MKLGTLKNGTRDGKLVVVSRDLRRAVHARPIVSTMQDAIENWAEVELPLRALYDALNAGTVPNAFDFDPVAAAAPLPRAYQWCDGSAFLNHGRLMEKAFGIAPVSDFETVPLMYQGASDDFLGPRDDVPLPSEAHGIDFEGEYAILVDDVPMGCAAGQAASHIKLLLQVNDVSLRAFTPVEMKKGFGFLHAKPSSSFAPVAVTPDELGSAWREGRVHLPLNVRWNGEWFGHPNGGEMNFSFPQLIAHAAATRRLRAGTVIGSGTVSNADPRVGSACIAERRALELLEQGKPLTGFMRFGDTVRMEVLDASGRGVFGAIDQTVVPALP
ncbi:fumarylacetoacetate (FAA) hydrolase [Archangium gephyra]|uniref:Fumarylacetoacetate (FAA) hydrolase n=1 Tax=Archangium gephyra TaxID=48 RepID=A0AAC8Q3J2_9BACT|nr:fumarylacetoacetate hydrolase family protein [Archangium gephyra]AKJ00423.1 Fumarylacetoacetate hydrolase family protein [Archangium gephyra]REG32878.1 fumarylacetoacetate (FAA) hydrolase [Archangium gephyra]